MGKQIDKYIILAAVRNLVGLLQQADEDALNTAYQYVANDANNSLYVADL